MIAQRSSLGTCPRCGASIASRDVLIEYGTAAGQTAYAECPGCEVVVHPSTE